MPAKVQRIVPFLWFDSQAEEAATYYVSIFDNSAIQTVSRYDEAGAKAAGRAPGSAMTVAFELEGQEFLALNGGPLFPFTEAVSFLVKCDTQAEVDRYWDRLTAGGREVQCGWLKDRFGLSWQVVPTVLPELLTAKDPARSQRVMTAMLAMKKLDIEALKRAYAGASG